MQVKTMKTRLRESLYVRHLSLHRIGCALVIMALAGCSTLKVGSDYDRKATFTGLHTFTVMQRQHLHARNPLVVTRAQDAIVEELQSKGYQQVSDPATADFSVDFTIGSHQRTDINSYPVPYAGTGWAGWGWGPGWWGAPYWGDSLDVRQVREGTLSIDVFDTRSHRPIWHGWAKKDLTERDIEQSEKPIREAVKAILAQFPPSGS
jgi:hypothetical protein